MVIENKDLTSPLFLVRTWEALSSCATFSLMTKIESWKLFSNASGATELVESHHEPFKNFCMATWCLFFTLSLLINIISVSHFQSFIPISWKNLTVTVAMLGALMSLCALAFLIVIVDFKKSLPFSVAAVVFAVLTVLAYSSESYILCTQAKELRGYMGSLPGLLKIIQLWGSSQLCPLIQYFLSFSRQWGDGVMCFFLITYVMCALTAVVTVVVILGECTRRCLLPFDKCITGFNVTGVLLYIVFTVTCVADYMDKSYSYPYDKTVNLFIIIFTSVTLLAYTVDTAISVKQLCNRVHSSSH